MRVELNFELNAKDEQDEELKRTLLLVPKI